MSTSPPTPSSAPAPAPKKPRSPAEKWLVRGGIVVLLLLVGVQAHARFGYEMSLKNLQARLADDDKEVGDAQPLLVSEVPQCIVGWPARRVDEERGWKTIVYSWRGLTQTFEIRMPCDRDAQNPAVLALETHNPPPLPVVEPPPAADAAAAPGMGMGGGPGMGGPGMAGGPGMGGGGPRGNIMDNDKDGDGKVSREEAPERMAQFFDRIDANADGYIDADEAAQAAERRRQRQPQGGGDSGGGRPRRPEGDAPAGETPAAAPPAEKTDANTPPAKEE